MATKTSRIPRKAKRFFWGGNFQCRISEYTQRERKCSFRKLEIFISQTSDSHFANYRFSFRKLQISISQITDFHFVSSHFVSFHFVSSHYVSQTTVSRTYYHSFMALNRCEKKTYRSFSSVVRRFYASCGNSYKALQFI